MDLKKVFSGELRARSGDDFLMISFDLGHPPDGPARAGPSQPEPEMPEMTGAIPFFISKTPGSGPSNAYSGQLDIRSGRGCKSSSGRTELRPGDGLFFLGFPMLL